MFNTAINPTVGREPRQGQKIFHLYVYVYGNDVAIEMLDFNLPISRVMQLVQKFFIDSQLGPEERQSPSQRYLIESRIRRNTGVKLHLMYDAMKKRLSLLDDSDSHDKGTDEFDQAVQCIRSVGQWITQSPEYFGEVERGELSYIPVPKYRAYADYRLMQIKDIPIIAEMAAKANFSLHGLEDRYILFFDFDQGPIADAFERQVKGFDRMRKAIVAQSPFRLVQRVGGQEKELLHLEAPFIVVDEGVGAEFASADLILSLLMTWTRTGIEQMWQAVLKQKYDLGYDVEEIFMIHFGDPSLAERYHEGMKREGKDVLRPGSPMAQLAERIGIDPQNDPEAAKFMQVFSVYHSVFPHSDRNTNYKRYYYFVSVDGERQHPAEQYEILFNELFKVHSSTVTVVNGRTYFVVVSTYCFPPRVFNLFGNIQVHDTYNLNTVNGVLSQSVTYAAINTLLNREESQNQLQYTLQVRPEFQGYVQEINGRSLKDNRMDEAVTMRSLSEYPYVHERARSMAAERGLPFKDIPVIMVYNPGDLEVVGGFIGKHTSSQKTVKLAAQFREFEIPLILLNMASRPMQQHENILTTLIHEYSHFLDEIAIDEGKADKSILEAPSLAGGTARSTAQRLQWWRNYLTSKTEDIAHTEEILSILRLYSKDTLRANWPNIKDYIIRNRLLQKEMPQSEEFFVLYELYGNIMDKALDIRINELEPGENNESEDATDVEDGV